MITIARREITALLFAPTSWVLAALFLAVEGYSFWLFVAVLAGDGLAHGAVLQYFFGGTFLFWLFLMFLCAALTMRLLADEQRSGTWEPLLTAPVDEPAVIVGKFVAVLGFLILLYIPTLLYVGLLAHWGAVPDPGPVAAGYLGVFLVGASTLGIGLVASSLTRSQLLAAALAFVTTTLLLLVGALGDILFKSGTSGRVLQYLNLIRHMEDFGRGIVDSRAIVYHLSIATFTLTTASRVLRSRRLGPQRRGWAEVAALAITLLAVNIWSARHFVRGDWTRSRQFALSDESLGVLRRLPTSVEILVFMLPPGPGGQDLFTDVRELVERAGAASPLVHTDVLDVDRDRARLEVAARRFGVAGDDLVEGVVVVSAGPDRTRFLRPSDLAEYENLPVDEPRRPRLVSWKGEGALLEAVAAVTEGPPTPICFTTGHGEPRIDSTAPGEYGDFAEMLRRAHHAVRAIDLLSTKTIPDDCALVVVAGPRQPFDASEAKTLDTIRRLLVLTGPNVDETVTAFAPTGLGPVLRPFGITLRDEVVVDEPRLAASVLGFAVRDGYADHPAVAKLHGHPSLWTDVRGLDTDGAAWLVRTSDAGWGETDLAVWNAEAKLAFDASKDHRGPVTVAAAGTSGPRRAVVYGSHALAGSRQMLAYNRELLLGGVGWLLEEKPRLGIGPRNPESARVMMSAQQVTHGFWLCVVLMPLFALLVAVGVAWRRRA